ncbi:MAG TPA: peptide deformylase [Solirubrobacteraceae bacterium]
MAEAEQKRDEMEESEREDELEPDEPPKEVEGGRVEVEGGRVEELDPESRARRDAALLRVRKLGDPVLRASALPVERFDDVLRAEIEYMGMLMDDALGVGLAATQIGVLHRVLVYRADPEDPLTALVNPVLKWSSEEAETASEGCLSLPFVHVEVERPAEVQVRARDAQGGELELRASGLTARVIQHEIDHLDGILILDRISREERKEAMRAMREAQTEASEAGSGPKRAASDADEAHTGADEAVPDASLA